MTNGEYFVLTHPNVEVKENGTCVWIYNLDNTACNHYTMSMEWWNEEMATVYEFKGCDNCELDRPKGKWIEYDEDGLYAGECSCCKWKAVLYESNVLGMNFCPNCGADMRGDI